MLRTALRMALRMARMARMARMELRLVLRLESLWALPRRLSIACSLATERELRLLRELRHRRHHARRLTGITH